MNLFLGAYRATPHTATGVPPAQLIFKFNSTSRLASMVKSRKVDRDFDDTKALINDRASKFMQKHYGDKKLQAQECSLRVGDRVLYQPPKMRIKSKLKPLRLLEIFKITKMKGSKITAKSTVSNQVITRNSSHFRKSNITVTSVPEPDIQLENDSLPSICVDPPIVPNISDNTMPVVEQPVLIERRILPQRSNRDKIDRLQVDGRKKHTYV